MVHEAEAAAEYFPARQPEQAEELWPPAVAKDLPATHFVQLA